MSRELPLRTPKVLGCWDPGSGFVPSAGDNRAGARPPGSRCGTAPRPATRSSWTRRGGRTQVSPRSGNCERSGQPRGQNSVSLYSEPGSRLWPQRVPGRPQPAPSWRLKAPGYGGLGRRASHAPYCPPPWDSTHPPNLTAQAPASPEGPYLRPMDPSPRSHAHCHPFLKP